MGGAKNAVYTKEYNRLLILRHLRQQPASRAELARLTGLTRAAISLITEELIDGGFVNQVQHAARVAVDEEGVTAAAFTVIGYCGAGMPPTDEMDLVFDRPFAFVIESNDNLPLFAGIVNEP